MGIVEPVEVLSDCAGGVGDRCCYVAGIRYVSNEKEESRSWKLLQVAVARIREVACCSGRDGAGGDVPQVQASFKAVVANFVAGRRHFRLLSLAVYETSSLNRFFCCFWCPMR